MTLKWNGIFKIIMGVGGDDHIKTIATSQYCPSERGGLNGIVLYPQMGHWPKSEANSNLAQAGLLNNNKK